MRAVNHNSGGLTSLLLALVMTAGAMLLLLWVEDRPHAASAAQDANAPADQAVEASADPAQP
ncbi:MAG: hypothetical protein ACOCZU_00025 [Planctomycetota bacterium]